LRDAGYQGFFGAGDAAASVETFVQPVGAETAEGVFFVGCPLELPQDFIDDFSKVHGGPPEASAFTAQYADAATVLLDAISKVAKEREDGSLVIDRNLLRDTIRETNVEVGLSGHIIFDEYGDRFTPESDLAERAKDLGVTTCQVQDGRLVVLFP
jgi:branched-chain amino acid transport system substrate-binding protein